MTNEEREVIENFFSRIANPQTQGQTSVAPVDPQANNLITQECQKYPYAQYRMAQIAIVQEAALVQAQNQIRQLQTQVQQLQQQMQGLQQKQSGGFFGNLFGGGRRQQATPPPYGGRPGAGVPPNQAQNLPYGMRPSNFRGGSGFLGSALTTATGVAGGVLAANALTSLFSGHHGGASMDPSMGAGDAMSGANTGGGFLDSAPADTGAGVGGSDPFSGEGTDVDSGFDVPEDDDWGGGFDDGGGFDGF